MNCQKLGIILLAAGGSRRLGSPKQLISYEGTSLIRHVAVTALTTEFPTVVVLGASAEKIGRELNDFAVERVENTDWRKGISTSIVKGVGALRKSHPDLEALIIMLCDQPRVDLQTITRLADTYKQTGMPIVACKYNGTAGVPALFGYEMFGELLALEGDTGAKFLIEKYRDSLVTLINAPEAALDVDTERDIRLLNRMKAAA
ncbi:MAG: nucleotidyltransferase family protein [Acidobacteria bacterium]|nr:MAG: nucleotidyltransferase family protein [Acidobacteriota bacterium]REK02767.1 MAG: nucleotidyltransferase family protein [Acidobacteriota bacterium]REK13428.1 MAG: nucleotidyltransferase family protein [Acidobacteriota bacterium]REK41422.1 MAG: nucleotidyltransferase family protein [Acidobacteriota bacterium]